MSGGGQAASAAGETARATPLELAEQVADIGEFGLAIADQFSAEAGLTYNLCAFELKFPQEEEQPKSAKSDKAQASKKNASSAWSLPPGVWAPVESSIFLQVTGTGGVNDKVPKGLIINSKAEFAVEGVRIQEGVFCIVRVRSIDGFDTKIGNQLSLELEAHTKEDIALLVFKGFIDPWGWGDAHFSGLVAVTLEPGGYTSSQGGARLIATSPKVITTPIGPLSLVQQPHSEVLKTFVPANRIEIKGGYTKAGFTISFSQAFGGV